MVTMEMKEDVQVQLRGPEKPVLIDIVRQALGSRTVELADWRVDVIGGSMGAATGAVYRVSGSAIERGRGREVEVTWSVILVCGAK